MRSESTLVGAVDGLEVGSSDVPTSDVGEVPAVVLYGEHLHSSISTMLLKMPFSPLYARYEP